MHLLFSRIQNSKIARGARAFAYKEGHIRGIRQSHTYMHTVIHSYIHTCVYILAVKKNHLKFTYIEFNSLLVGIIAKFLWLAFDFDDTFDIHNCILIYFTG